MRAKLAASRAGRASVAVLCFGFSGSSLAAQPVELSGRVVAGGGSETFVQIQMRAEYEAGPPSLYVRAGGTLLTQQCALHCNVPDPTSLDLAGGISVPLGDWGQVSPKLDVGGGVAVWEGSDPLAEAEVGFPIGSRLTLGVRSQVLWMGDRSRDDLLVRGRTLKLVGLYVGIVAL